VKQEEIEAVSRYSEFDRHMMSVALRLARRVKGTTFPNPAVGAVIVNGGRIVGKGATAPAGKPHAEKNALRKAGRAARGGTLYVTLEPCSHHGRTPPCTEACIDAGITKVFVAVSDPNPLVHGKGIARLRRAGISVSTGCMRREAKEINEEFFYAITTQRCWITCKLACTLDGRIADFRGNSKWISSQKARTEVHALRRIHAGIAVGGGTVRRDDPLLTVRFVRGRSPARIVFSSCPSLDKATRLYRTRHEYRSILVCPGGTPMTKNNHRDMYEIWYLGGGNRGEQLDTFTRMAYKEEITSVMIEGGQKLASAFLENRMVNKIYIFYGNRIVGNGLAGFDFSQALSLDRAITITDIHTAQFDTTVMICGYPQWNE
jgi:diaminohydroxyphosphoribosylaminopyrimidine deaminase/5-amino-6-(5-phosphoribosylamino)uracil reductase